MNMFTLLTAIGAFITTCSFFHGARPASAGRQNTSPHAMAPNVHEKLFGLGIGLTVLAALHAG